MGMSSYVVGIVPPDETWKKMKAAWDACEAAGIPVPEPVRRFFNGEAPDPAGVVVPLGSAWKAPEAGSAVQPYKGDAADGFEVDLAKLPPHVKRIRFVNSY